MNPKNSFSKIGKISVLASGNQLPPFEDAVNQCKPPPLNTWVKRADSCPPTNPPKSPAAAHQLLIEEAFSMMARLQTPGIDEESITAVFMGCWAASHRFWKHNWVWQEPGVEDALWLHLNKTAETRTGADFALVLARLDGMSVIIAQAKKFQTGKTSVNLARLAYKTVKGKDSLSYTAAAIKAEPGLEASLRGPTKPALVEDPEWQLTRFLQLQDRLNAIDIESEHVPVCVYVFWPDDPVDEPLYKFLDRETFKNEFKKHETTERLTQVVDLDKTAFFRDLLIDPTKCSSMPNELALKVVNEIEQAGINVVVVDLSGQGLEHILGSRPHYKNLITATNYKAAPSSGMKLNL
jgi:hypothetical protein